MTRARRAVPGPWRPGFTVVELLVVIGVLIGIISTLVVGVGYAMRRARVANTDFLMNSVMMGLAQFKVDAGYYPPVLGNQSQLSSATYATPSGGAVRGWGRDAVVPPQLSTNPAAGSNPGPGDVTWDAASFLAVQRWYSVTTIPEYLIGPGDRSADGYGVVLQSNGGLPADPTTPGYREQPALGIRNPGKDGAWGAFLSPRRGSPGGGTFASRNVAGADSVSGNKNDPVTGGNFLLNQDRQNLVGRSLGPYVDTKVDSDLGAFTGLVAEGSTADPDDATPQAARPGESVPSAFVTFDGAPKALVDFFGNPILYYRRGYRNNDPRDVDRRFSLADVVALRPTAFAAGEAVDAVADRYPGAPDTSAARAALGAEVGLLSFGPDRRWNQLVRADADGFNEDNIVRLGP